MTAHVGVEPHSEVSTSRVSPKDKPTDMRIGLNLLHALPEIGGGWNYIANLVAGLGECDDTNTYVAFVTRASECLVPAKPNFESVIIDIRSASRVQRVVFENTVLQVVAKRHKLDCMHWFANTQALINAVPGVVTVYDLASFLHAASRVKRYYLRLMISVTAKRASVLLPISQATAQELHQILNVDLARMVVIPPVLNSQFKLATAEEIASFRAKYRLPDRFWLYVAHMYPHKNHVRLLQAYRGLKSSGFAPWPLVLRGDPHGAEVQVRDMITYLDLERDVIFLLPLSQEELPVLYSAATALVFPSLYEGGGIPVVEAMACGCPVIASSIPPVMEFAGEAASYFDPRDPAAIGQAMMALQYDTEQQEKNRQAGLARAEEFIASRVVGNLLAAYSKTVKG